MRLDGLHRGIGVDSVFRNGAPRPMKMGTTRSPFPYDAVACHAFLAANLRLQRFCATPHGRLSSRSRRVARLPLDGGHADPGIDATCHRSRFVRRA